jgi:hypothetical protein
MKQPINKRNQRGMSVWLWLMLLMILAGAAISILRLGPHYIDFRIVQSVADRLDIGSVHQKMSRAEIMEHFEKQFRVESIYTPVSQRVRVDRDREQTVLNIDYEVREHLFFDIDVVLSFNEVRIFE